MRTLTDIQNAITEGQQTGEIIRGIKSKDPKGFLPNISSSKHKKILHTHSYIDNVHIQVCTFLYIVNSYTNIHMKTYTL